VEPGSQQREATGGAAPLSPSYGMVSSTTARRLGSSDDWKWHDGATLGSGAPAAKLRHGGTMASKGEHGACGTYPETTTRFGQRGARTGEQLRTRVEVGELYASACGMRVPPTMANGSTTPGDRVTDRWAPRVSDFQISEKLKNAFSLKKNRYKVRKNMEKSWR
jgi:hypothetical protein